MTETWEQFTCPLEETRIMWDEEGTEQTAILEPCESPLYLERTHSFAIYADDTMSDHRPEQQGETDRWQVVCENGHVLLTSSGEETAEPFDPSWLNYLKAGKQKVA